MKKVLISLAVVALLLPGCTLPKLEHFGKTPLNVTTVDTNFFNVRIRFGPLTEQLRDQLDQPVNLMSDWNADSIKVHFAERKDYYDLLYLDPVQFCQVAKDTPLIPLAVRKNLRDTNTEVGLIVVKKDSDIKAIEDIKGKRFAFGPYGSPYLFYNVLELLRESTIPVSLLNKVLYSKDNLGVVQNLLFGLADVGVVTETWWETTTDRTLDLSKLLKDDLRIIARTRPMPDLIWAATEALPEEKRQVVKETLTKTITDTQRIVGPLKAKGFVDITDQEINDLQQRFDKIKNLPPKPSLLPLP